MKKRLAEDVIVEILVKLSVKSLLRFRCVCKSWFHLIKSPYFINLHLKHYSTTKNDECVLIVRSLLDETKTEITNLISFHSYESLNVVSPPLRITNTDLHFREVCGPCNGLLCLSLSDDKTIVLCNPSMREFKELPPSPFPCPKGWYYNVHSIGLGFDSNSTDYKVITIVYLCQRPIRDFIRKAEIYNLSTNSWREIDHDMPYIDYGPPDCGTLFNGAFHWIATGRDKSIFILSFDMSTEVFRDMELPDDHLVKREIHKSLTVINESLAFFVLTGFYYDPLQFVDIWVMQEYGVAESWTKQFIIGPATRMFNPRLLWKNEAILSESLSESRERRLVSHALDTHEMNDLEIHDDIGTFEVMVYQESLISIK